MLVACFQESRQEIFSYGQCLEESRSDGDVVLDSLNMIFGDKVIILDQIYAEQICPDF